LAQSSEVAEKMNGRQEKLNGVKLLPPESKFYLSAVNIDLVHGLLGRCFGNLLLPVFLLVLYGLAYLLFVVSPGFGIFVQIFFDFLRFDFCSNLEIIHFPN
jgi:hypothetical protein